MTDDLADPSTTVGRLQRGRGAGWLEAAAAPDGRELLATCLLKDPRWDGQVESRAAYYAQLAVAVGLLADELDPEAVHDESTAWLRIDVLAGMASRGDKRALSLLLDLARPGPLAASVVGNLLTICDGLGVVGVERLLVERFDADDLDELVDDMWAFDGWDKWATRHEAIGTAVRAVDVRWEARRADRPPPPPADAPIVELLAHRWIGPPPEAVLDRLVNRPTADELTALRAAAVGPSAHPQDLALRVLGLRQDPIAFDVVTELIRSGITGWHQRRAAVRYLEGLDPRVTLPLARQWLTEVDHRGRVAESLMALHSEEADVPTVRVALERAWTDGDMYGLCSLIEALGRQAAQGPYEELRVVFTDAPYSYARRRAAQAMAAVDPGFGARFATECLWDCEEETRVVGAVTAPDTDALHVRLATLSVDPHEEASVVTAAAERLRSRHH